MKYFCELCNFHTNRIANWNAHIDTQKHIVNCYHYEITNSGGDSSFYECKPCEYSTNIKCNYKKHISSLKHNQVLLHFAKKPADVGSSTTIINNITNNNITNNNIQTTNTMNNTLNDQKFNLNVFLNEDCKDAMNLTDFINNISLTLTDLENTARLGYTDGITKIINDRINDIGEKRRPYHCTDKKRHTVYVKDDDLWEKEPDDKPKIKKMISNIIHKNIAQLSDWKKANPECNDISNHKGEQYLEIMVEANGGPHREEKEDQILKNVIESVAV